MKSKMLIILGGGNNVRTTLWPKNKDFLRQRVETMKERLINALY